MSDGGTRGNPDENALDPRAADAAAASLIDALANRLVAMTGREDEDGERARLAAQHREQLPALLPASVLDELAAHPGLADGMPPVSPVGGAARTLTALADARARGRALADGTLPARALPPVPLEDVLDGPWILDDLAELARGWTGPWLPVRTSKTSGHKLHITGDPSDAGGVAAILTALAPVMDAHDLSVKVGGRGLAGGPHAGTAVVLYLPDPADLDAVIADVQHALGHRPDAPAHTGDTDLGNGIGYRHELAALIDVPRLSLPVYAALYRSADGHTLTDQVDDDQAWRLAVALDHARATPGALDVLGAPLQASATEPASVIDAICAAARGGPSTWGLLADVDPHEEPSAAQQAAWNATSVQPEHMSAYRAQMHEKHFTDAAVGSRFTGVPGLPELLAMAGPLTADHDDREAITELGAGPDAFLPACTYHLVTMQGIGTSGLIDVTGLADDTLVLARVMKENAEPSLVVEHADGQPVTDVATVILGPDPQMPGFTCVWTVHPGLPVRPASAGAQVARDGDDLTVGQLRERAPDVRWVQAASPAEFARLKARGRRVTVGAPAAGGRSVSLSVDPARP